MNRIIKRIIRTITTVTWSVHWEENSEERQIHEEQVTLPASYTLTEEQVIDKGESPTNADQMSHPTLDKGERS